MSELLEAGVTPVAVPAWRPPARARATERLARVPAGWLVAVGLLAFAALWLALLAWVSLSPPADDIEQLSWVRSLEWGYYKHPPLPTWLLWLPVRLLGLTRWAPYLLGAACTMAALAIYWHLLRRLRGPVYALIGLLAALCISYYNGRLYYYNHNVVLLLASTACAALTWQAVTTRRLRWWLLLGVALGLGALSKYQIALTLVALLAFFTQQGLWREPRQRLGLWSALLLALLLFLPHLVWLGGHDYGPIGYALGSSLGVRLGPAVRFGESLHWLLDQLFNRALPALLLLALVGVALRRPASAAAVPRRPADAARALLLCWGMLPLLCMTVLGLLTGADLQLQWGTAFLVFVPPLVMELWPGVDWAKARPAGAFKAFVLIQLLLLTLNLLSSPRGPAGLRDRHWRAFDSARLTQLVAGPARAQLQGPIRVIGGDATIAGAVSLRLPEHPLVLIDRRLERSPWLPPELPGRCGVLEIGHIARLAQGRPVGPEFPELAWRVQPRDPAAPPCPDEAEREAGTIAASPSRSTAALAPR